MSNQTDAIDAHYVRQKTNEGRSLEEIAERAADNFEGGSQLRLSESDREVFILNVVAEVERLKAEQDVDLLAAQDALASANRRAEKAEAEVERLREALKVAREYVKATEGQLVTRPNIVTKDRELCDAALRLAERGSDWALRPAAPE